jgi:hypothetical protein
MCHNKIIWHISRRLAELRENDFILETRPYSSLLVYLEEPYLGEQLGRNEKAAKLQHILIGVLLHFKKKGFEYKERACRLLKESLLDRSHYFRIRQPQHQIQKETDVNNTISHPRVRNAYNASC